MSWMPISHIAALCATRFPPCLYRVVPANAGTHNPKRRLFKKGISNVPKTRRHGVWVPARASLGRDDESAQHRQRDHIVAMANAAFENGVFEFEFEAAGGADAADGGEGA